MTRTTRFVCALSLSTGLLAPALGCSSGGSVNLGDTQQLGGKLSDYAATWDGYAEAYTFMPSGTDNVHLVLDAQGNGTLQVGTDALLAAPTDPDVGFPPNVDVGAKTAGTVTPNYLQGGVLYPVSAAQVEADRIQFGLKPLDYYAAWCALQTPHYVLDGYTSINNGNPPVDGGEYPQYMYSILPGAGGGAGEDASGNWTCEVQVDSVGGASTQQPIDCGKFYLGAEQVCACTATSCGSSPAIASGTVAANYPAEIDGALDSSGNALTGTLVIGDTRIIVHLTRK
jgi:hypothetical protein